MGGAEAAQQPQEGAGEAVDPLNRCAVRPDDTARQRVVGAVEEMMAVHQQETFCGFHTLP